LSVSQHSNNSLGPLRLKGPASQKRRQREKSQLIVDEFLELEEEKKSSHLSYSRVVNEFAEEEEEEKKFVPLVYSRDVNEWVMGDEEKKSSSLSVSRIVNEWE